MKKGISCSSTNSVIRKPNFLFVKECNWALNFTPYKKINSKWIKDPNIRSQSIKPPDKNRTEKLHGIRLGWNFLEVTTKIPGNKRKVDRHELVRCGRFCERGQATGRTSVPCLSQQQGKEGTGPGELSLPVITVLQNFTLKPLADPEANDTTSAANSLAVCHPERKLHFIAI